MLGAKARRDGPLASFPLVHVKDIVVFPNTVVPFVAVAKGTVAAVDEAVRSGGQVFVALLKPGSAAKDEVDVHRAGTLCHIAQRIAMPDGTVRLILSGRRRGRIERLSFDKAWVSCEVALAEPEVDAGPDAAALCRVVKKSVAQYSEIFRKVPQEILSQIESAEAPELLCDLAANIMAVKPERKQAILECADLEGRLRLLVTTLETEIEILGIQKRITAKVKAKIERNQREYYLQEQVKEINKELGREGEENEGAEIERRLLAKGPPEEVIEKARKELGRLGKLQALSPEAGVLRTYCEWLADLPWSERTEESKDIEAARAILDRDHFGLKKPKERILEFIAVRQLNESAKGPILCFTGPPGTGKTSLAQSVARALGRKFVRISLGGVRDEAEIRGHRKTYVGALPGKIIQSMRKAGTVNPVFLLDEIDKMNSDFRGDPASAMLEVLDPEQNRNFQDHYLEVAYDLSKVMFITTANSLHAIPYPLLDRMEVIEIPGYSEFEKLAIAKQYIIPRQLSENGLESAGIEFRSQALLDLIRFYTMESGVRNLEREIARVVRRIATEAVGKGYGRGREDVAGFRYLVSPGKLKDLLGPAKRSADASYFEVQSGCAVGLAWTELGGAIIPIESVLIGGDGSLILTGNLGDVMKESARTALSFIRSRIIEFPAAHCDFKAQTIHIHVPEGAIPKDGPSAGITILSSMLSLLSGIPPLPGFAMTGEITLSGKIIPVGGIKEKVLAAHRNGLNRILLPEENRKDMEDIPKEVLSTTEFFFAGKIQDALKIIFPPALFKAPKKRYSAVAGTASAAAKKKKPKTKN
jgi:ATP-dependent Lon protease